MRHDVNPDATLDAALHYRGQGCSVFALPPRSKRADQGWKRYQNEIASKEQLVGMFANDPHNLAIVTGAVSQIVVLDVDHPEALANYPALPETVAVKSGREGGGLHFYFNAPVGFEISNLSIDGLGDLKANGGYVVAPPSVHPETGERYEWIREIGKHAMAEMPNWLLKLATDKREPREPTPEELHDIKTTKYGAAWLSDVADLARAGEGNRNNLLNEVACKAGSLIAARQLNEAEAMTAMEDACRKNGLANDRFGGGMLGVVQTIRSGLRRGKVNPRHPMKAEDAVPVFSGGRLQLRRASTITAEKIGWLWTGTIALGHLAILAGDPGTGKSQLSLSMASIISRGGKWPVTGERVKAGNVIILSMEDRAEDVIVPRLMAAGADLDRVHIVGCVAEGDKDRDFRLKEDMALLHAACDELGSVSLVIVDPISSYMGGDSINDAGDVRAITNELAGLAQKHMASVLMVTHNSKAQGQTAGHKVTGSHAWVAAARTAFSVTKVDGDLRTMAPIKANTHKDDIAYHFTVEEKTVGDGIPTSAVRWETYTATKTADDVLAESAGGLAMADAKTWILESLSHGPRSPGELEVEAEAEGIRSTTFYEAKRRLGDKVLKVADPADRRKSTWMLKEAA